MAHHHSGLSTRGDRCAPRTPRFRARGKLRLAIRSAKSAGITLVTVGLAVRDGEPAYRAHDRWESGSRYVKDDGVQCERMNRQIEIESKLTRLGFKKEHFYRADGLGMSLGWCYRGDTE